MLPVCTLGLHELSHSQLCLRPELFTCLVWAQTKVQVIIFRETFCFYNTSAAEWNLFELSVVESLRSDLSFCAHNKFANLFIMYVCNVFLAGLRRTGWNHSGKGLISPPVSGEWVIKQRTGGEGVRWSVVWCVTDSFRAWECLWE